ncbi:MAG: hypothetical protein M3177_03075 [Pseudomonadota bacterium]|nr:hypothetical protein [Pseudomonadota bacterium]
MPDLCEMPFGFRTWQGAEVLWTGVVIGEHHHGYVLACEHRIGGISITWSEDTVGRQALEEALERPLDDRRLLRIRVEGRLSTAYGRPFPLGEQRDPPLLRIRAVHDIEVIPLTLDEHDNRN